MMRWRWRHRRKAQWQLVRWQEGWALLIALPQGVRQVQCICAALGVQVGSQFRYLVAQPFGEKWHPVAEWQGTWTARVPLTAQWRLAGSPRTVHWQGLRWLLLPLQRVILARQ